MCTQPRAEDDGAGTAEDGQGPNHSSARLERFLHRVTAYGFTGCEGGFGARGVSSGSRRTWPCVLASKAAHQR